MPCAQPAPNPCSQLWDGMDWRCVIGIPDAPRDGLVYGRENGVWQQVVSANGGEINSLTIDGTLNSNDIKTNTLEVADNANIANLVADGENVLGNLTITGSLNVNNLGIGGSAEFHDVGTGAPGSGAQYCLQVYSENSGYLVGFWYGNASNPLTGGQILQIGGILTANGLASGLQFTGTAAGLTSSSDAALKIEDRTLFDSGLVIDKLIPRCFRWKEDNRPDYGFFAQEMEPIFPLGAEKQSTGWVTHPDKLIPLLVEEVQKLRKRIKHLEGKSNGRSKSKRR